MSEKKYIIWSEDIDYENDWKKYIEQEFPKIVDQDEKERLAYEINQEHLEDERMNLDIETEPIIAIADLGLWRGHVQGYKEIGTNVKNCLYSFVKGMSSIEFYLDKNGDLCADEMHHDGTNHYVFRAIKPDVSDETIENLKNKLYYGNATRRDITRATYRLGDIVAKVYGWEIPGRKPSKHYLKERC